MLIFQTDRLIIRDWDPETDAEAAYEMYSDPEVMRYLGLARMPQSVDAQREHLREVVRKYAEIGDGTGGWAITDRATGAVAGCVLLKQIPGYDYIEVGWHLPRRNWGRGYATEAGRGALEYGFAQLGFNRIVAVVAPGNEASIRVAERLGMKPDGTIHAYDQDLRLFVLDKPPHDDRP